MNRLFLLTILLILEHQLIFGQELIINGSFEDVNICREVKSPCSPAGWFSVSLNNARGYIHQHYQQPPDGNGYLDLLVANAKSDHRTYWQSVFFCPMVQGEEYELNLYLAAEHIGPNINDIGFWFHDKFLVSSTDTILRPEKFLDLKGATVKKIGSHWFRLSKKFIAGSNASVIIFGNFSKAANSRIIKDRKFRWDNLLMMVDKLSIHKVNSTECNNQNIRDSIYAIKSRHGGDSLYKASIIPVLPPPVKMMTESPNPVKIPKVDTIVLNHILFDYDSHQLKDTNTILEYKAALSKEGISAINIVGYTDDQGTEEYNLSLSGRRAKEIQNIIVNMFGIPASRIKSEGRGISRTFDDPEKNRRVEIYIYY